MSVEEVLDNAKTLGVILQLEGEAVRAKGRMTPQLRAGIRQNKPRLVALLRLREFHRLVGLDQDDMTMIERAMLQGQIGEVVIVPLPPDSRPA